MKTLNVTVQCMAVYNSSIEVPDNMTLEEAIKYAKEHINEINCGELEYVSDSDILDEENCVFEETQEKVQIFYSNIHDRAEFEESLKYWSSAIGDLHHHGKEDITEEQLPPELQRAYNELWSEDTGSYCYLVETPKGYGIALINEYDKWFSEDCGLSTDELFQSAIKDAYIIADDLAFSKADIYLGESMGLDRCHELAVIFPTDISKEEFDLAATRLEALAYQSAKSAQKPSLSSQIEAAANRVADLKSDIVSKGKEPEL